MNYFSNLNLLPPPSVSLFRDLLWYVLSSSFIHFDETDEYFVQTSGVAMGSCISIFAANCYVWETMRPSCDLLDLRCTLSLDHPDDEQHDEQHDDAHDHDFRGGVGTDDFNAIDTANNGVLFLARYVDDFLVVATTTDDSCALFHQFNLDSPEHDREIASSAPISERMPLLKECHLAAPTENVNGNQVDQPSFN